MTLKSWIAIGMILITCAWAAWLFGTVDWATAQKESISMDYSPDTAALSLSNVAESTEKTMRVYLQDADRVSASSPSTAGSAYQVHSRRPNLFGTSGRTASATERDDGLDIININTPKIAQKLGFPVDRYKLTGIMLGPDPRVFVLDTSENRTRSFRIGDKIDNGTINTIDERGVAIHGEFGTVYLKRNP